MPVLLFLLHLFFPPGGRPLIQPCTHPKPKRNLNTTAPLQRGVGAVIPVGELASTSCALDLHS